MWAIGLNNLQIAGALLLHFTCKLLMEGSLKIHVNTLKIIYCLIYLHDYIYIWIYHTQLLWWLSSKETACNAGDTGLIPGLGKLPGEGNGNPLQYSCLNGQRSLADYKTIITFGEWNYLVIWELYFRKKKSNSLDTEHQPCFTKLLQLYKILEGKIMGIWV